MNIQNIATLAAKLERLGFENTGYLLLKNISFRPQNFWLVLKAAHLNNALSFHIFIQRNIANGEYELQYYDANISAATNEREQVINGINLTELITDMGRIDWKNAFDFTTRRNLSVNEKSSFEKEEEIESVTEKLQLLEQSENGKYVAANLKLEFWSGLPYHDLFGNIAPVKNKYEISQRFYCATGQPGISIDEAYRFLQNRLLEKQISLRKKQPEISEASNDTTASQHSSSSNLLKKRRIVGQKNSKRQHS